jgi:uncharacterized membrane protein YobD (UPF0266 family)
MQEYSFKLENSKSKLYDRFALFLLILVLIAVAILLYRGTPYVGTFLVSYWWAGLLLVLLIALYFISKRKLVITINKDHITYPSFPKMLIHWAQLNNVILKDGILTIDLKNNKIIQHSVNENVNEKEFNDFCSRLLTPNS